MTIINGAADAAPSILDASTDDETLRNVRVVDASTGTAIERVITADADAGKVSRYAIDADGNLVRENDTYQIVDEDRAIAIEWIVPPVTLALPAPIAADDSVDAEANP